MSIRTEIKNKESQIIKWWNTRWDKFKIEFVDDDYSNYDFEGKDVIVEVKHRFKAYDTKMIETMKLSNNYQQSQIKEKIFIYIVVDKNGLSIFNISKNIDKIIKLTEYNKLMEHTHYWSEKKIMKLHRNLPKRLSILWEHDYE